MKCALNDEVLVAVIVFDSRVKRSVHSKMLSQETDRNRLYLKGVGQRPKRIGKRDKKGIRSRGTRNAAVMPGLRAVWVGTSKAGHWKNIMISERRPDHR